jgi:hypothetical protein
VRILTRIVVTSAALALVAGCEKATGPESGESTDLEAVVREAGVPVSLVSPNGAPLRAGPCEYSTVSHRFECPPLTLHDGVTATRSYAFFDAAGNPQRAFDRLTTDAINTRTRVTGTPVRGTQRLSVDQSSDVTVRGLAGEETQVTVNGTSHATTRLDETRAGVRYVSDMEHSSVTTDLVQPIVRPAARPPARTGVAPPPPAWPLSGTIRNTISGTTTMTGAVERAFTVRRSETITFNGTSVVTVEITDGSGTRTCRRDLANAIRTACEGAPGGPARP